MDFTHNRLLDNHARDIFNILIRFLKHAKKIVTSDAMINDNILYLLSNRLRTTKSLYVKNTFKKYKDVNAIRLRDENVFLNKLIDHVKNKKYFFFGCDSKNIVTKYYYQCLANASDEEKDKFI